MHISFHWSLLIANPLGSGKTKHKINATYFTTYEVQPAFRSKIQSVQLVSLTRSKFWKNHGNLKANERLLEDLKQLETDGIEINKPVKRIVKAGLIVLVGDNLGLNQLGEYNACFSSGNICRICTADYDHTCRKHLRFKTQTRPSFLQVLWIVSLKQVWHSSKLSQPGWSPSVHHWYLLKRSLQSSASK